MSISKVDFIARAKQICGNWYFKHDAEGQLLLMEKPFVKKPGWDQDYVVLWYPKEAVFNEAKLNHLKMIDMMRRRGQQRQIIEDMTHRNKLREEASRKNFLAANRQMFKEALPIFKNEAANLGITRSSLGNNMKDVAFDDTKKVVHKTFDYAEKVHNGEAKAAHPADVYDLFRRQRARDGK